MPSNPLTDALPPKVRKYLYAALFVGAIGFSAYQAAGGDWRQFIGGLFTALVSATAASNVDTPDPGEDGAVDTFGVLIVLTFVGVVLLLFGIRL